MEILAEAVKLFIGRQEILKGVDFRLHDKEFLGIIGPNGSGKSMFLKCIYRVQHPDEGAISFDGRPLDDFSYQESARRLSVVAQHNFYSFDFPVLDVVLMGRSPHKKLLERDNIRDYEIARKALDVVGMAEFEERSFSSLSGGEQQRVILARALAQQTECMVLDEPTNHLDIKYQLQIMDIVKGLGLTVAAAIHDLNIAALYCDRLIAIKKGKVVGLGTPRALLTEKFIYDLYEVKSTVSIHPDTGRMNIVYLPQYDGKINKMRRPHKTR
jgi:iron compound ABC transporter, ATP-binding protein